MTKIAVVPGDGIGVEVTRQAVKVLECVAGPAGLDLELVEWDLGAERYLRTGIAITDEEMAELETEYRAILLGALGDPRVPDHAHAREILLGLRFRLDLYVNLRPVRLHAVDVLAPPGHPPRGCRPRHLPREHRGDLSSGWAAYSSTGPRTRSRSRRTSTRARASSGSCARLSSTRTAAGRRRVTLADKANAMRHAGGLWRRVFDEVGAEYPDIERDAMYIDAMALDMVLRPARYDVIVASNLFGDILSDLAAALVGGLGLAPSANLHPGKPGLFEPVHGSAPDIAGQDRANPLAAILTAALMLEQLGYAREASRIERAVAHCVEERRTTPDLGGQLGTEEVGDEVCRWLRRSDA